jgi:hypothetical protein
MGLTASCFGFSVTSCLLGPVYLLAGMIVLLIIR